MNLVVNFSKKKNSTYQTPQSSNLPTYPILVWTLNPKTLNLNPKPGLIYLSLARLIWQQLCGFGLFGKTTFYFILFYLERHNFNTQVPRSRPWTWWGQGCKGHVPRCGFSSFYRVQYCKAKKLMILYPFDIFFPPIRRKGTTCHAPRGK